MELDCTMFVLILIILEYTLRAYDNMKWYKVYGLNPYYTGIYSTSDVKKNPKTGKLFLS